VEQGKLSLDADVNTYLDFTIPATYSQPVTMRNLLTHTSGFEDVLQDLFTLRIDQLVPLGNYLKTHIPTRVAPPGTVIAYSNFGTATAGYIVERVSGMPFSTYVEKNIFQPLGMDHSTFVQPLPETLAADMSKGYNDINGGYPPGSFELVQGYPVGSMSATAADMAYFMIAHLQNGEYKTARILAETTAQQMHSPLYSQDPSLHGMAYGFFETEDNRQRMIMHGGDTLLFHTGLYLLPDQNVGIFISTNTASGGRTSYNIYKAFMDRYYPVPAQAVPPAPADFASRAGKYAGEYYTSRSNYTTLEKMFRLFSRVTLTIDKQGNVLLSEAGDETRYTEVEPGRLVAGCALMPVLLL
jgi:CubicO group peptidase (beta-lactamase class C family)